MTEKKTLENFFKKLKKNEFKINDELREEILLILKEGNYEIKKIYSKDYFKKKFPQFPEGVHALLWKVGNTRVYDYRKENIQIKKGKFILTYE